MKDPIMRQTVHDQYKLYRNNIYKITQLSKANHYKKFLEDNKAKLLKVWGSIKEIIRTKVTSKKTINSIFVNDKITTDASKIANFFNDFYCNIPKKIEKEIPNTLRNYKDYLTNPQDSSFFTLCNHNL